MADKDLSSTQSFDDNFEDKMAKIREMLAAQGEELEDRKEGKIEEEASESASDTPSESDTPADSSEKSGFVVPPASESLLSTDEALRQVMEKTAPAAAAVAATKTSPVKAAASGDTTPVTADKLPETPKKKRRVGLLAGLAVIFLAAVGAIAFAVTGQHAPKQAASSKSANYSEKLSKEVASAKKASDAKASSDAEVSKSAAAASSSLEASKSAASSEVAASSSKAAAASSSSSSAKASTPNTSASAPAAPSSRKDVINSVNHAGERAPLDPNANLSSPAFTWKPGLQDLFIKKMQQMGYIQGNQYKLIPACISGGQGWYNLYTPKGQFLVSVNAQTGQFLGTAG